MAKTSEFNVKNIEDFISKVTTDVTEGDTQKHFLFLYRGQRDITWELLPKIARQNIDANFLDEEKEILNEFKRIGRPYIDSAIISNTWDLIALAQHHGLPTRLLDWSTNPLVALWFAFFEKDETVSERAVWVLILEKNELANIETEEPFALSKTKAFKPNHITRRLTAQSGWFTAHKFMDIDQKFIRLNTNKIYKKKIVKFILPNSERDHVLNGLDILGINYFSLFPDLDGLTKYLDWKRL
jgi:hypothetical protein